MSTHFAPHQRRETATIAKVIAGGHRLEVTLRLAEAPCDVSKIAKDLDLGVVTISQNLRILADHGLVVHKRKGKQKIYSLAPSLHVKRAGDRVIVSYEDAEGNSLAIGASI